jgi:hypothetical protein
VTDEASAIEGLGLKPRLVMGDSRNIKVTFPEDLAIAELIIRGREGTTAKMKPRKKNSTELPRRQDAKKKIKRTKRK